MNDNKIDVESLARIKEIEEICETASMAIIFNNHRARLDWIYNKQYKLAVAIQQAIEANCHHYDS